MISRSQMNRQLYQMGGEGMQKGIMQMAPQEMQPQMQDQSMQPQMQSMQAPLQNQEQPQLDPNQAIEILVRMLMEQGIPQEEAVKIAMQMIQAVAEGGIQEVSDDTRIEARFGGRIGYAGGGISRLVDREQYGFGSIFKAPAKILSGAAKAVSGVVKGVTSAVKKVASSDLGKLALMAAAIYAGGGGFGLSPGGFSVMGSAGSPGLLGSGTFSLGESVLGQKLLGSAPLYDAVGGGTKGLLGTIGLTPGYGASIIPSGISSLIPGKGSLISAGAGLLGGALAGGIQPPEQQVGESPEQYQARVAEFQKQYQSNLGGTTRYNLPAGANNPFYSDYQYAANGGRIGYQEGGIGNIITQATQEAFFGQPQMPMMANGGRMGFAAGTIFKGLSKLAKAKQTKLMKQLDEAYELTASRNDFDFNDYKMRGRLLAEELAEIRYGKAYDDLDLDKQLKLYKESSDFLNDAAADYGDTMYDAFKERGGKANGGRMGYAMGNSVQQGIMAAPQIANQMGMPVGTPRMNEGGVPELDYRDEGGFVPPIGIKERADDIPAMLSNNEFVFTADAVKNADPSGNRDPEEGAKVMYRTMKMLESGGMA